MNRKEFILISAAAAGSIISVTSCVSTNKKEPKKEQKRKIEIISDNNSLADISHLLRRTTFGNSQQDIRLCQRIGLYNTIEMLFNDIDTDIQPPVNFEFKKDIYAPIGETWIDKPYLKKTFFEQYRKKSLQAWIMKVIYDEKISLREQMTLFWHNHFGVSDIVEHKYEYIHNTLLRNNAWGNYKQLIKKITIDPAMLRFLSGFDNTKQAPNENFARELLELFTIGKGEMIKEGDYTNYTEDDVRQIAKILTGWTDKGWYSYYKHEPIGAEFSAGKHNPSPARLSEHFDNKRIPPLFKRRFEYLIDVIFEKPETARYICRKLYRWFVHHEIDAEIEQNLIQPLAVHLKNNDYELQPVLKLLFKSKYFYLSRNKEPKIKNPVEFTQNIIKYFSITIPDNIEIKYNFWHELFLSVSSMGLEYFKPPSVAGWKAYYQSPLYYKTWINSATLQNRRHFIYKFFKDGFNIKGYIIKVDYKQFLAQFAYNLSPEGILQIVTKDLFQIQISDSERETIISKFKTGMSNDEWAANIKAYISNVASESIIADLETGLSDGFTYLFCTPEYQII